MLQFDTCALPSAAIARDPENRDFSLMLYRSARGEAMDRWVVMDNPSRAIVLQHIREDFRAALLKSYATLEELKEVVRLTHLEYTRPCDPSFRFADLKDHTWESLKESMSKTLRHTSRVATMSTHEPIRTLDPVSPGIYPVRSTADTCAYCS